MKQLLPIYKNLTEIAQENYRNYMNIDAKITDKTSAKKNPTTCKKYSVSGPIGIYLRIQGLFNI